MEMNDEITIVRYDRAVERNSSDLAPIPECATFKRWETVCLAFISGFYIEHECPLGRCISAIIDLRHDFIAEIQIFSVNSWLICRNH